MATPSSEVLVLRGSLEGHNGWVTSLATSPAQPNLLLSASRDKTLITWKLTGGDQEFGVPVKSFTGHSHIVQDCILSNDGNHAFSASWDKTIKLWNLATGDCINTLTGHLGDVMSISYNEDLHQLVSASRDKTVRIWNTLGQCLVTLMGHSDWVSQVKAVTSDKGKPIALSAGSDKIVKFWDLRDFQLEADFIGHNGYINAVAASPDGTLAASAGKDGKIMMWDLNQKTPLFTVDAKDEVFALVFSPNRFWVTAATASGIKIFDLESKSCIEQLNPEFAGYTKAADPHAISLAWSADGQTLFAGYTDNVIRVWQVMSMN
ncbi:40S ribosomal protein RACK1 SCDLUD_003990 [Saccharomycodes ludwigii]|uniref:40S ribosomal protein RACK1 n=1 Tax=Saccharomycodes ludwigii TaxID=36035 RepID=UPI001E886CE2|nr:hypothetical protein SCDLUD_003990 [Saccharomycodes ludwigii]KAH3899705.1 hypothetical protein SCDLUD_003990 [Saccharomycodes ludwigii]